MRCRHVAVRYAGAVSSDVLAVAEVLAATRLGRPAADVWETGQSVGVRLDVPGVAEEDLHVVVHPDALVVAGERRAEPTGPARWHVSDVRPGPFRFAMRLPPGADPARARARLERGVLHVHVPKTGGGEP